MSEDVVIDKELLKAIGADTRISILKSLSKHQKTQSDLAKEFHLSNPTILEHLNHLTKAGLVEKMEEGRKWKYYVLTRKARKLISSSNGKISFNAILVLSFILIFVVSMFTNNPYVGPNEIVGEQYSFSKGVEAQMQENPEFSLASKDYDSNEIEEDLGAAFDDGMENLERSNSTNSSNTTDFSIS